MNTTFSVQPPYTLPVTPFKCYNVVFLFHCFLVITVPVIIEQNIGEILDYYFSIRLLKIYFDKILLFQNYQNHGQWTEENGSNHEGNDDKKNSNRIYVCITCVLYPNSTNSYKIFEYRHVQEKLFSSFL